MKTTPRKSLLVTLALALLVAAALGRQLGSREARQKIAEALGLDKPDRVHIKSISTGLGGDAIVEATFDAAFHFTKDKKGDWVASEVRTGDRRWESIELIQTAVRKEKVLRTIADMTTLATALESFKRVRGYYVRADDGAGLVDHLAPEYLKQTIRLDAWSNEFGYSGGGSSYRLISRGPDGKPGTADDIVMENGTLVSGVQDGR